MGALANICRAIAAMVPGTRANVAKQKRTLEKFLRANGHSKDEALFLASERFRKRR